MRERKFYFFPSAECIEDWDELAVFKQSIIYKCEWLKWNAKLAAVRHHIGVEQDEVVCSDIKWEVVWRARRHTPTNIRFFFIDRDSVPLFL